MRRIEMTWDDGAWEPEIADMIVEELLEALDHPTLVKYPWVRPDSIKVFRLNDRVYPDGPMRRRDGVLVGKDVT